jgi:1-acyl-sn-glycerol-3-phosphate acyltransferase
MSDPRARGHSWLPRASCDADCVRAGAAPASPLLTVALRVALRGALALLLALGLPLLAVPLPGRTHVQRAYCRLVLRCLGVRIAVSGGPIRNLCGVLVVSGHVSWLDIFAIGAVLPGSFVARADVVTGPLVGTVARVMKVIPIERASLRRLPGVVDTVARRLRAGHTVVAFPEGTTWCGLPDMEVAGQSHRGSGPFYPAMFQAAIDAGRPVQPVRLTYHHRDGSVSTVPAYIGDETLPRSICRVVAAPRTLARVHVESLQLPGTDRRDLAGRCHTAVRSATWQHPGLRPALVA